MEQIFGRKNGVPRVLAGIKDAALPAFVASGIAARASALSHVGSVFSAASLSAAVPVGFLVDDLKWCRVVAVPLLDYRDSVPLTVPASVPPEQRSSFRPRNILPDFFSIEVAWWPMVLLHLLRYRVDPDAARTFNEPFVVAQEELHPGARGVFWNLRSRRSVGSFAPLDFTTRMNTYLNTDYLSKQPAGFPGTCGASSPAVVADDQDLGLQGYGSMWHRGTGGRRRGGVVRGEITGVSLMCSTYLCPRRAAFLAPPSLGGWPFCCVSCVGTWGGSA